MLRMTITELHHPKKEALAQNYSTPRKEPTLILTLELHGDCSSRATRTATTILLPATAPPCIRVAATYPRIWRRHTKALMKAMIRAAATLVEPGS